MDQQNTQGCNRRDFLKTTGVGVAALSFAGAGLIYNSNTASAETTSNETVDTDILVIGGGIAGTFAALKAKAKGVDVTVADKGRVGKSGLSPFWQGTAIYDPAYGVSEEKMMKEWSKAEEYLTNQTYTKLWIDNSKNVYEDMVSIGIFGSGENQRGPSRRKALVKNDIRLIERTMITSLLTKGGRVVGAIGFPLDKEDTAVVINAKAVIMCAGAGTFKTPGWPGHSLTHDGDAMAYRVGAEVTGKEFVDYHGTFAEDPGGFGVTSGDMPALFSAELMYPGIVARPQLADEQAAHVGNYPMSRPGGGKGKGKGDEGPSGPLGLPGGPLPDFPGKRSGSQRPPRPGGGRPMHVVGGSSAGASPHKCEGIVPKNGKCESTVQGLYAAGDALCSAGTTYGVGCSSSSQSAVQGAAAGGFAAEYAKGINKTVASKSDIEKAKKEMLGPRQRDKGFSPRWITQVLQGIMVPYYVLSVKKDDRLKAALSTIEFLRDQFGDNFLANDVHELRLAHETKNMLLNAEMRLKAGLFRTESRGSHFREDYPARDDENWLAWVVINSDAGKMKLTKRSIPEEWKPDPGIPYKERYPYSRYLGEEEFLKKKGIKI